MSHLRGEPKRIADQLLRSLNGDAWHGPSLLELLSDVSPDRAAVQSVDGAHSIWELILHVRAWIQAAGRMLDGHVTELIESEDWPPTDARNWVEDVQKLSEAVEELASRIEAMSPEQLSQTVAGRSYSIYELLHGVVQHNLYHAGQIAILKRAAGQR